MKEGYVLKSKSGTKIPEKDLELINKLTRRKFSEEEVYIFSLVLCDNEIDRENERFTDDALETLAELYVGVAGVLDHKPTSENQTARIYECSSQIINEKTNRIKQPYKRVLAKAYMPRSEKNKDLILEIDSGIKKEVSVGCSVACKTCSICGADLTKQKCAHIKGHRYKKDGDYQICHTILDCPMDAYEWSFVAVPAQKQAGVIKSLILTKDGGEKSMQDVLKSLGTGQSVTLSKGETEEVFNLIKELKEKAELGNFYKEELKEETLRLSAIIQPEISLSLIKSVSEKLSVSELKLLRDSFKSKLSQVIPPKPQFSPQEPEPIQNRNTQFKI